MIGNMSNKPHLDEKYFVLLNVRSSLNFITEVKER